MEYLIRGGQRLFGAIRISGSKNAVLPILAASAVTGKKSVIHNCPDIADVRITIEILKRLGFEADFSENTITVDSSGDIDCNVSSELMGKLRSSVIFLGAFINRCKAACISPPGGCVLGERPIDIHLNMLGEMGVNIELTKEEITYSYDRVKSGVYEMPFPSVGATENLVLAALSADGTVIIKNVAREPEIVALQDFLNACGANVSGAGTSQIAVSPVSEYHDCEYTVISDRIEAATYMAAATATGGTVQLQNAPVGDLAGIITMLSAMGVYIIENGDDELTVFAPRRLKPLDIVTTKPHPGFPTDAQAILMATLLKAKGSTLIVENIFESRYNHIPELIKMGANIASDGKTARVHGVETLRGAEVTAMDLRAGASLIIAALCAEGNTYISGVHHVERGYENIVGKLQILGADIRELD